MDARRDRLILAPEGPEVPDVRAALAAHARAAFPHECCGYVTAAGRVVACANAAADPARAYEIAGAELLALVRGLAGPDPARAIYHSHTNGRAYFSPRDAAIAATADGPIYPVDHVVIGVRGADAAGPVEAAQFAWDPASRAYREVARWPFDSGPRRG